MTDAEDFPCLVTYPPLSLRLKISDSQWSDCISDWCLLCRYYLTLPLHSFLKALATSSTITPFLSSYLSADPSVEVKDTKSAQLHEDVFRLIHRCLHGGKDAPRVMLQYRFLGQLSRSYRGNESLRELLLHCWNTYRSNIEKSLMEVEQALISASEAMPTADEIKSVLVDIVPLVEELQPTGEYFLVGSDVLDSLVAIYVGISYDEQKLIQSFVFACFYALLHSEKPNHSLVFDHIYSLNDLRSRTGQSSEGLKADLVNNTALLQELREAGLTSEPRYKSVMKSLEAYQRHDGRKDQSTSSRIDSKGKGRFSDLHETEIPDNRKVLISQVQDLLPNLGSAFANKLLEEYADNLEDAIAHFLEDNLPPYLQNQDRSENLPEADGHSNGFVPRGTPPPQTSEHPPGENTESYSVRRNYYDNDAFDRLEINPSQLHFGRKEASVSLDDHLQADSSTRVANKSAIYAALAAFDPDDDERDDTYDIADVGGTVDVAADDATKMLQKDNAKANAESDQEADDIDGKLWHVWQTDQTVFGREPPTRRSVARQKLKAETGLTDEAIEGWALMIRKDPKRLQHLHDRFLLGAREGQTPLARTAWASNRDTSASEDDSGDSRGSGIIRGSMNRGSNVHRGGRGRGSAVGTGNEKGLQTERQHKETNKSSRANHNRRNQRAKKMARAG